MSLSKLGPQIYAQLEARGLTFVRFSSPQTSWQASIPNKWTVTWKDDHLAAAHGEPPVGFLILYPVALKQRVSATEVVRAFLDEFVVPAMEDFELLNIRPSVHLASLPVAEFQSCHQGMVYRGLAVSAVDRGRATIAAYWVQPPLYRETLIEELLIAVMGTAEEVSADGFQHRAPPALLDADILPAASMPLPIPFAPAEGRFAVQLPLGWTGQSVSVSGADGWLLLAPTPDGKTSDNSLVSISGADLAGTLDETIEDAIRYVVGGEHYAPDRESISTEVHGQLARLQTWLGYSPEEPKRVCRLWSLGITDGISVVHLLAIADAGVLQTLLPAIRAIGASVRVLPRIVDLEAMQSVAGMWRCQSAMGTSDTIYETQLELLSDGSFRRRQFLLEVAGAPESLSRKNLDGAQEYEDEGNWDIVHKDMSIFVEGGVREIWAIQSLGVRSMIVNQVFWERF